MLLHTHKVDVAMENTFQGSNMAGLSYDSTAFVNIAVTKVIEFSETQLDGNGNVMRNLNQNQSA